VAIRATFFSSDAGETDHRTRLCGIECGRRAAMPSDAPAAAAWLTIDEAAQQAGVSRWTVRGWIARGQLPSVRIDRRRRIDPTDLAAAQEAARQRLLEPAWRRNPTRAGLRLRRLREAKGLNQQELATRSGLTHEEISRLELGH
jgi:excisionase family DNA binding protein